MKKICLFIFIQIVAVVPIFAQQTKTSVLQSTGREVVFAKVENGDTIPIVQLPEVSVYALRIFEGKRDIRNIQRMIIHVKKAYPYAKLAGMKLDEYEYILSNTKDESERRKIMRKAEKELNDQFGDDLKDLTFTQGKILLKLIDRETGDISYNLVKDLRGGLTATFYQGFARLWGYNLKTHYDPTGEDELIETIVIMIENGQL
jgi:hypothetical protein